MPLGVPASEKRHDETEQVIQHFSRKLDRVLDFLGYTIDDVVNDPVRREHVKRAYLLSLRIDRDLLREPWRTAATSTLAETVRRRIAEEAPRHRGAAP